MAANRVKFAAQCNGTGSAVAALAGQKWKQLCKEEQKPYELEYQQLSAEYANATARQLPARKPRF